VTSDEYVIYRPLKPSPVNKKTSIVEIGSTSTEPTFLNHADMATPLSPSATAVIPLNPVEAKSLAIRLDRTIDSLLLPNAGVIIEIVITAAVIEAMINKPETITLSI
jgi:hypothetical protein